jgi:glycosyltransferase involved in cell wall biosynthesis
VKLIIQIPCYNEEKTLPVTLNNLPKKLESIDEIEYLIIDDGSLDNTVDTALKNGVKHVVKFPKHRGLAKAFMAGIENCINLGADIIVNIDADNQYCSDDIEKLIKPIIDKKADVVIGARPITEIAHFSFTKKILQKIGSMIVRVISGTSIPDAPSGFRAISREASYHINVFSNFTYTLETIIQAGQRDISIISVPIRVNEQLRPSRLIKSIPQYINRSIITIFRIFMIYQPLRFFLMIGSIFFASGVALGIRFIYFLAIGNGMGHIQSLILTAILLITGFLFAILGLIGDLISINRKLLEDIQYNIRKSKYNNSTGKI